MYVFEITIPGTWIEGEDHERAWDIQCLLRNLESQFYEANFVLNLFISALKKRHGADIKEQWEADVARKSEIRQQLEEKYGGHFHPELWDQINFESEVIFKREQWEKGRLPREFEHNEPIIYARTFLYAIDAFDKFLKVLSQEEGVPETILQLQAQLGAEFPDLRGVRNTAQHLEDRSRGL